MKKTVIVLGTTATLLAGILAPTTGFAAERSAVQPEIKNVVANFSVGAYTVSVGSSISLDFQYKNFSILSGWDVVSVDYFGRVTGLKPGLAYVQGNDGKGNTKTFIINVFK